MDAFGKLHRFEGRLLIVGFGCVGQGVLPLLLRHLEMLPAQVLVIAPDAAAGELALSLGARFEAIALNQQNAEEVVGSRLRAGDFLLNLAVNVSSVALIRCCRSIGALYLDTCIEPWEGYYIDASLPPAQRTNHALREAALALRGAQRDGPTAVITHGANPGLVSYFVKQALLDIAHRTGMGATRPSTRDGWARLALELNVLTIHIAERDTQSTARRKRAGEFVNTWSVEAFVDESLQPAELGWGTHERTFPADGMRHESGCGASIYLQRCGAATRVRSWTPLGGPMHGFLITHSESISIADHLTLGDTHRPRYRPTVLYAYHPCDDAVLSLHELAGRNWRVQPRERVLRDEIASGIDELGVLLAGHERGAYWYGSQLSIEQARELCPFNSATSLQVTAAVMAGVVWAMRNPRCDVVEPDDLPFDEMLGLCRPYLGHVVGVYTEWTPLEGRPWLFPEELDPHDPWQFRNVRVT